MYKRQGVERRTVVVGLAAVGGTAALGLAGCGPRARDGSPGGNPGSDATARDRRLVASALSTELEALASILGPDFSIIQQKAWHGANAALAHTCEIILRPEDDEQKDHVAVVVHIILTKTYPNTAPSIAIKTADKRTVGVSRTDLGRLNDALAHRARSLIGAEMIWELVSYAQEFISVHNEVPRCASKLSLEQEMRMREHDARHAAEVAGRIDAERRHREELERSKALASQIQLETTRQETKMRDERQRRRAAADALPPPPEQRVIAGLDAAALAVEHVPLRTPISWQGKQVTRVTRGPPLGVDTLSRTFVALTDLSLIHI